ncbi:MAG TPA: hypothetical protein VGF48_07040 [Thermoanaerobaculia bacterium]|jgi:hypothetical protein
MHNFKSLAAASLAVVLLTACGSAGGLGDILGGGSSNQAAEIRGTVDYVDTNNQTIRLTNVSGLTSMLSSGGGNTAVVFYETNTPVEYQGKSYRPENLERGDQVAIRVDQSNNRLIAEQIAVTYNAGGTSGSNYPSNSGSYGSSVRGTIRYVDTNRRSIEIDRGSGSPVFVEFETNTPVYYSNQTYRVSDLERGDEVDIRVRDMGNNRFIAEQVTVVRSVSGGVGTSGSSSTNATSIRGTVSSVDTNRRLIYLDSTQWMSNFQGSGSAGSSMVVSYDANTSVDVNGRLHPVNGLERGDVVDVQVRSLGGSNYLATRVILVRDVNAR